MRALASAALASAVLFAAACGDGSRIEVVRATLSLCDDAG